MTAPGPAAARRTPRRLRLTLVGALVGLLLLAGCGTETAGDGASSGSATSRDAASGRPVGRVAPLGRSAPQRVRIPSIGVDSSLMALGLKDDGTLQTPPAAFPAGWFTGAPTPGQIGPAIIVGHVRFGTPGVFENLGDLSRGDRVVVTREDGRRVTFGVTRVQRVAKSRFPTRKVYGDLDHPGLRLITCGGLDPDTDVFEDNVVVFADLVSASPA